MLDKERIPVRKKHGKSEQQSTAKDILEPLRIDYPVLGHILDWGSYETLRSTFVDVLPTLVQADGRIHTTIKNTRTITGRLAMENPNLQNIPVRTEEGRMIRDAFVSSPGYIMCSFDYSQIELRVASHESQDAIMLDIFLRNGDIHSETASRMFGVPIANLNDYLHRRPAKTVNFGILYGISPPGLALKMETEGANKEARKAGRPIPWTEETCGGLIGSWLGIYKGVAAWRDDIKSFARRNGYVLDLVGRRRLVPEVRSSSKKIVEEGLRYAMNHPVQGGAADIIKKAMVVLWRDVLPYLEPDVVRPLLQIHDDLVFEIKEEEVGWISPIIQGVMESAVKLAIPTPVDPKQGERWGSMVKLK